MKYKVVQNPPLHEDKNKVDYNFLNILFLNFNNV